MSGSPLIRAPPRLAAKARKRRGGSLTQSSVLSVLCPQSDLRIPTSVVTCLISDLVRAVFITCTDGASSQDGISNCGCCGLVIKQAGEGALGRWLNLLLATKPRTESWEDTPWVCRPEPGRTIAASLQDFAGEADMVW